MHFYSLIHVLVLTQLQMFESHHTLTSHWYLKLNLLKTELSSKSIT